VRYIKRAEKTVKRHQARWIGGLCALSSEIDDGKILGAKGRPDRLQHADGQA
jgi:hypothetical protein